MNEENKFEYIYSANQQEEIKMIREKYISKEEVKLSLIRKLDNQVTSFSTVVSIAVGVIGAIIFGAGMSCCLVWGDTLMLPGIIIGIIGMIGTATAYPLFVYILKKKRKEIAPEIIKLTDELLK